MIRGGQTRATRRPKTFEVLRLDVDRFLDLAGHVDLPPYELHGTIAGFLCGGGAWEDADDEELGSLFDGADGQVVRGLLDEVNAQLASMSFDFVPLVPDDEHTMPERLAGLAEWARGFVLGFGLGLGDTRLEGETLELISDLLRVAELDADDDDSEENEVDFMEVFEFTRVAALTLHGGGIAPEGDFDA